MKFEEDTRIMPLPNKEDIIEFEEYCEIKLPTDYKTFVMKNGGIEPFNYTGTFVAENDHEYVIDRFLTIVEEPEDEVLGNYDISYVLTMIEGRLSDDGEEYGYPVIPIAVLFAGDFLCLDFREVGNKPKVVVWDHERSDDWKPVFYHVANSFDEFMEIVK